MADTVAVPLEQAINGVENMITVFRRWETAH